MKRRQRNKMNMYGVTEKVLDDNVIFWNSIPAFADAKNSLSNLIIGIHDASREQQERTTGITTDKREMKIALAFEAATVAGLVSVYASDIENFELRNAVRFTQRSLIKYRENAFLSHCRNIYTNALANSGALVPYGITPIRLSELETHINQYQQKSPKPRAAQARKKALTISLKTNFAKADKLLKLKLDNLMLSFKATEPGFYIAYKSSRNIIDLGQVHTRLRMFVKDSNGNALEGANVTLVKDNTVAYTETTGAEGKVFISRVSPGMYNLEVHKAGYAKWTQPEVNFVSGKRVMRTAVLAIVAN